jgi:hypothetical protein
MGRKMSVLATLTSMRSLKILRVSLLIKSQGEIEKRIQD